MTKSLRCVTGLGLALSLVFASAAFAQPVCDQIDQSQTNGGGGIGGGPWQQGICPTQDNICAIELVQSTATDIAIRLADAGGGYAGTTIASEPSASIGGGKVRADYDPPVAVTPGAPIYWESRGSATFAAGNPYNPGCHQNPPEQECITLGTFSFGAAGGFNYDMTFQTFYVVSAAPAAPAGNAGTLIITAILLAMAAAMFVGRRA